MPKPPNVDEDTDSHEYPTTSIVRFKLPRHDNEYTPSIFEPDRDEVLSIDNDAKPRRFSGGLYFDPMHFMNDSSHVSNNKASAKAESTIDSAIKHIQVVRWIFNGGRKTILNCLYGAESSNPIDPKNLYIETAKSIRGYAPLLCSGL